MMKSGCRAMSQSKWMCGSPCLKNFDVEADVTYRDYKKFRTDTKIVPVGELQEQQ